MGRSRMYELTGQQQHPYLSVAASNVRAGDVGELAAGKLSGAPGEKREEKPLVQVTLKCAPRPPHLRLTHIGTSMSSDEPSAVRGTGLPHVRRLPLGYVYNEAPVVARWDERQTCWRQDGVEAVQFREEERELQFRTAFFGTLALLQDRYVNMPFQSWTLRARAAGHCALTVIAAINEVTIEIRVRAHTRIAACSLLVSSQSHHVQCALDSPRLSCAHRARSAASASRRATSRSRP